MKVRVIKGFQDVVTERYRNYGDVFDIDDTRINALKGYVEEIDKPKQKEQDKAIHATK